MKRLTFSLFFILIVQAFLLAQNEEVIFTPENFDFKFLTYQPVKRADVSPKDYERGKFILEETHRQMEADNLEFNCADYWNITMAFFKLGEPKQHIEVAFQRAIEANPKAICEYLEAFGEKSVDRLRQVIPETFLPFYQNCGQLISDKKEVPVDNKLEGEGLNSDLVNLMSQILKDDQKYRLEKPVDWSKQKPLDEKNLQIIDSLFQEYGTYIGRGFVGKDLEITMWLVVQHSNLEKMEAYLPVIHKAVEAEELSPSPLKMLLDRIHCIKYNYQIFGSQYGGDCELAKEEVREEMRQRFGLN